MSEETPEIVLMVNVFESKEDFEFLLKSHGKIFLYEVKREKGYTYWFFCEHCHDFSVLKTVEPFEYSYDIDQIPKTKVTVKTLKVRSQGMSLEGFMSLINGDE